MQKAMENDVFLILNALTLLLCVFVLSNGSCP